MDQSQDWEDGEWVSGEGPVRHGGLLRSCCIAHCCTLLSLNGHVGCGRSRQPQSTSDLVHEKSRCLRTRQEPCLSAFAFPFSFFPLPFIYLFFLIYWRGLGELWTGDTLCGGMGAGRQGQAVHRGRGMLGSPLIPSMTPHHSHSHTPAPAWGGQGSSSNPGVSAQPDTFFAEIRGNSPSSVAAGAGWRGFYRTCFYPRDGLRFFYLFA